MALFNSEEARRRARDTFFFSIVACIPAFGQLTEATFKGVFDSAEGAIQGAVVTARNEATGLVRTTKTADSGAFLIAGISPGPYTVNVAASGFKAFERQTITLSVGQTIALDIRLQVGDVQTQVEVSGGEVLIQVANEGRLSDTFKNEIAALPLPERSAPPSWWR